MRLKGRARQVRAPGDSVVFVHAPRRRREHDRGRLDEVDRAEEAHGGVAPLGHIAGSPWGVRLARRVRVRLVVIANLDVAARGMRDVSRDVRIGDCDFDLGEAKEAGGRSWRGEERSWAKRVRRLSVVVRSLCVPD